LNLKQAVNEFGQQSFYAIANASGKVQDILEDHHSFTVAEMIVSFEACLIATGGEKFDDYELDEIPLSHLLVESMMTDPFRTKIRTRFSHHNSFDDFPGSIYFLMALDTCNASVAHEIDGAVKLLDTLSLAELPGESVTECATEAQRLFKIMKYGYALPTKTGSHILGKFTKTSSEFSNCRVFELLAMTKKMETKYKLRDPKDVTKDTDYHLYGPLALIATLKQEHSDLVTDNN